MFNFRDDDAPTYIIRLYSKNFIRSIGKLNIVKTQLEDSKSFEDYKSKLKTLIQDIPIDYLNIDSHYFTKKKFLIPNEDFMMDAQGWYSIMTLGAIERTIDKFMRPPIQSQKFTKIIDFFAGCGGTTYGFAKSFPEIPVSSVELDTVRHTLLSYNTRQLPNVQTIHGSVWDHAEIIDDNRLIFMSPPWGKKSQKTLETMMVGDKSVLDFLKICLRKNPTKVILHLPRYITVKSYRCINYNFDWFIIQRPKSHPGNIIDRVLLLFTRTHGHSR